MNRIKHFICLIIILTASAFLLAIRADADEGILFSKNDKVLILAPHPDDEAIASSGVMQRALRKGAKVRIIYYTNGDNNEIAFIARRILPVINRFAFIRMGESRRLESVVAMHYMGIGKSDMIFLGYPDFGTMEILNRYWDPAKPYKSFLTRTKKVPYPECLSPGAPYIGQSILSDLKKVITDFKPTKIFVSNPADTNRDHRALYLFTRLALWDLAGKIKTPEIFPYIIHVIGWPKPRGYHPELGLDIPPKLEGVSWTKFPLTPEEVIKKHSCISYYKSQISYSKAYLFTFARKNELFGDYPAITLKAYKEEIKWSAADIPSRCDEVAGDNNAPLICSLEFARNDKNLFLKLGLKNKLDKDFGISVDLLGYSKNIDFALMPKLHINIDALGMNVRNKKKPVSNDGARVIYKGNELIIEMPLRYLGDPDRILSSVRTADLPYDETTWRIIELN